LYLGQVACTRSSELQVPRTDKHNEDLPGHLKKKKEPKHELELNTSPALHVPRTGKHKEEVQVHLKKNKKKQKSAVVIEGPCERETIVVESSHKRLAPTEESKMIHSSKRLKTTETTGTQKVAKKLKPPQDSQHRSFSHKSPNHSSKRRKSQKEKGSRDEFDDLFGQLE